MRLPHLPPDSCFAAKAWLGGSGLAVGLLGMATEHRWAVWIAVGLTEQLTGAFSYKTGESGDPVGRAKRLNKFVQNLIRVG